MRIGELISNTKTMETLGMILNAHETSRITLPGDFEGDILNMVIIENNGPRRYSKTIPLSEAIL